MSKFLTPAQQEYRLLANEADALSQRQDMSRTDQSRMSFLLAKMKALQGGFVANSSDECREFFGNLFKGRELRTTFLSNEGTTALSEGTQSITWSQQAEGGALVPHEFYDQLVLGMAQFDPLLDKNIVTVIESGSGALPPFTIPGWDLSTYAAVMVAEGVQAPPQVPPTVSGTILNGYKFKCDLPISLELEEDAFQATQSLMQTAFTIGFGRGIGKQLILGNGTTAPQGILAGTPSVYTTASPTALVLNDFENVYFKIDRAHRNSPKCAWLMNDAAYQLARKATDSVGNPLLKLHKDKEMIMGKPVYISPSLPSYNASLGTQQAGSFCVFGDLEHYFVRVSKMSIARKSQLPGYIEFGTALYTGIMRADAKVFDPTGGNNAPIVSAQLHE